MMLLVKSRQNIEDIGFFLLRSPSNSLNHLDNFLAINDRETLEKYLLKLCNESTFTEGLHLASDNLYKEVKKWLNGEKALSKNLIKTLYKYITRQSYRCTPYGNFAGIAIGKINNDTTHPINIVRNNIDILTHRLDIQFVINTLRKITSTPSIKHYLNYSINDTLYRFRDYYKFYQNKSTANGKSHYLSQIRATPIIMSIINEIKENTNYNDLITMVIKKGADNKQAMNLIDGLIANQVLICDFEIKITSKNCLGEISKTIKEHKLEKEIPIDFINLDDAIKSKKSIFQKKDIIRDLFPATKIDIDDQEIFQADLRLGIKNNEIAKGTIDTLIKQIEEVFPLSLPTKNHQLDQFKQLFITRYEGEMRPLLEVLDPDSGIGYGSKTLSYSPSGGLLAQIDCQKKLTDDKNRGAIDTIISRKSNKLLIENNQYEINLTESDICEFSKNNNHSSLSPSSYAIGSILLDNKKPIFSLHAFGGSSGANLISRFVYLDEKLQTELKTLGRFEQEMFPNAIVAEIVHIPHGKAGNILQRPNIRDAEIALLAKTENESITIKINELYLFIQNDRIILWSKKLNREIIPRLTSAHNFRNGLGLYTFIADLQYQDFTPAVNWINNIDNERQFYPRIRYKDLILTRATWNLPIFPNNVNEQANDKLEYLRKTFGLPQKVVIVEGDNELLIDFSNTIGKTIFLDMISRKPLIIKEYLFDDFQSPVIDLNGASYTNEIVIPFVTDSNEKKEIFPPKNLLIQRNFMLGSEWIYFKIYCGAHASENILEETISVFVHDLKNKMLIKQWFFVRYNDPEYHIRIRLKIVSKDQFAHILNLIYNKFNTQLSDNVLNIQFDTYKRELERYSPECMELCEEHFHLESEYVLSTINNKTNELSRWQACLRGINILINCSLLSDKEKIHFTDKKCKLFANKLENVDYNNRRLNDLFRMRKIQMEKLLNNELNYDDLKYPEETFKTIIQTINNIEKEQKKRRDKVHSLLSSHIHMFVNRIFPTDQMLYEYILYHMLGKYYIMQMAKNKNK